MWLLGVTLCGKGNAVCIEAHDTSVLVDFNFSKSPFPQRSNGNNTANFRGLW